MMRNFRIIPENNQDFLQEHSIINPPSIKTVDIPKRYYRYVIDSRDRNLGHFLNPSSYEINLSEDIHDVQSVELISFDIPFTKYLINEYNNKFHYELNGVSDFLELSVGEYESGEDLVSELNLVKADKPINFNFNTRTKKISMECTQDIKLLCEGIKVKRNNYDLLTPTYKSALMKLLGLSFEDVTVSSGSTYVFPYQVDLRNDKYIVMSLSKSAVNFSENNSSHKSFALIKKNQMEHHVDMNYKKYYNPPIPAMNSLKIDFKDYDGNEYDFQNQDHMIELLFCCFKQQRKYNDIL